MSEVENIANTELKKVSMRGKGNEVRFNDQKSKLMLMTRRKRKERKDLEVYLNNKQLRQVRTMKYLGIRQQTNVQRTHYTRDRKMKENNICLIEFSETKLGTKP